MIKNNKFNNSASADSASAAYSFSQKSLVVWGTNLTSTVGLKFTRGQLAMVNLVFYTRDIIVGLLLSDGYLSFTNARSKNVRLGFKQSLANASYAWFVFSELSHYCGSIPRLTSGIRAGKRFYGLEFFTRCMPCLALLFSLFYPNGIKIVPHNIYELLTPVVLAHLIMGDGSVSRHGLIICTDSYKIEDTIRLMNVLIIKYGLECSLRAHRKNQYRIYIRQASMSLLLRIVGPHMHSSMLYKLKSHL